MKDILIKLTGSSIISLFLLSPHFCLAQELKPIKLNPPDKKRGLPLMDDSCRDEPSVTEWSERDLTLHGSF